MDTSQNNSNEELLKALERFGFKFFGYNESKEPLVMAPNGQIVSLLTAYTFLQKQLKDAKDSQGGIESMPNMPVSVDSFQSFEAPKEKLDNNFEKKEENPQNVIQDPQKNSSPKIALPQNSTSPFSDGYFKFEGVNLDLNNPENVILLESYIQKNAKKDNEDPVKWLSFMFQKTLQELREEQNK